MAFDYNVENVIEVDHLWYTYMPMGFTALKDINLTIKRGEFLAIIGQNGSGKTTLIKHFIGLHRATQGEVRICGKTLTKDDKVSDLAQSIGYVFQNPSHQIFSDTVENEVAFGPKNIGFTDAEIDAAVTEALEDVGLTEFRKESPVVLGRGQMQRLAIASILSMKPKILIIDEPTTGLDWRECVKVMEVVKRLNESGHTIIMTTHNMNLVSLYAKRAVVLRLGEKLLDGPVDEVFSQTETLRTAYIKAPQIYRLLDGMDAVKPVDYTIKSVADAIEAAAGKGAK